MRPATNLTCALGIAIGLAACSGVPSPSTGRTGQAIVNGTLDGAHSAVVSILIEDTSMPNQGGFDECSGSIVQVAGGVGTVLTAAHCCGGDSQSPDLAPSIVVLDADYGPYENDIGTANPAPPAYPVVAGSVQWDQQYNGNDHDFCMLQFSGAPDGTPTLALPTSADDGLSVGADVEFVGFGVIDGNNPNDDNSRRYHATAKVDQSVTSLVIQYSQGHGIGGPCEGDSGGPALVPAGAPQSQQVVVATTSYGDQTCSSYGVSSRVSSEIGAGGFITQYLAGGTGGAGGGGGDADGGPPPPPPDDAGASCSVPSLGQGVCISTSDCAAQGNVSSPGFCPGAADIQCCTPPGQ